MDQNPVDEIAINLAGLAMVFNCPSPVHFTMEVSRFITQSLNKQERPKSLQKAIAVQNALFYMSAKYPVSFFYCSGYRRQELVELIMNLVDEELISLDDVTNDPMYSTVFIENK